MNTVHDLPCSLYGHLFLLSFFCFWANEDNIYGHLGNPALVSVLIMCANPTAVYSNLYLQDQINP